MGYKLAKWDQATGGKHHLQGWGTRGILSGLRDGVETTQDSFQLLHWKRKLVLRRTLRFSTGIGLVVLGIVGLILPIMPGWVFVIPGLIILSDFFPPVKRLVEWAKVRAVRARESWKRPE